MENGTWVTRDPRNTIYRRQLEIKDNEMIIQIISFPRMWRYYGTFIIEPNNNIKIHYHELYTGLEDSIEEDINITTKFRLERNESNVILTFDDDIMPLLQVVSPRTQMHPPTVIDETAFRRTYYLDSSEIIYPKRVGSDDE